MHKIAKTAAVGLLAAALTLAGVSSANATNTYFYPDNCDITPQSYYAGDRCPGGLFLYYHANGGGASASIAGSVANLSSAPVYEYEGSNLVLLYYADIVFSAMASGDTDGEGQAVRDDAGSATDTSSSSSYTLYVYPSYVGSSQTFTPNHYYVNLNSQLHNNEASVLEH